MLELAKVAQVVSSPSRLRIVEELMRGPKTPAELAASLSLKPVTIHHHLPWLERAGVIEQAPVLRSGLPGRPTTRYRLTTSPLQINLPPREFKMLAGLLADVLLATLGKAQVTKVARGLGLKLGKQLAAALLKDRNGAPWTVAEFRRIVVDGNFAQRGYAPEVVVEKPGSLHFRLHNCLVLEIAREHPEFVCEMDLPLIGTVARATMGAVKVERIGCMGHGAPCCEYKIRRTK